MKAALAALIGISLGLYFGAKMGVGFERYYSNTLAAGVLICKDKLETCEESLEWCPGI